MESRHPLHALFEPVSVRDLGEIGHNPLYLCFLEDKEFTIIENYAESLITNSNLILEANRMDMELAKKNSKI